MATLAFRNREPDARNDSYQITPPSPQQGPSSFHALLDSESDSAAAVTSQIHFLLYVVREETANDDESFSVFRRENPPPIAPPIASQGPNERHACRPIKCNDEMMHGSFCCLQRLVARKRV